MDRISLAQWFKPERRALQSSNSLSGTARPYFDTREEISDTGTTDSCLYESFSVAGLGQGAKQGGKLNILGSTKHTNRHDGRFQIN